MKLTKEQLKHIIKEELIKLNEIYEEQMPKPPTNTAQPQQGEKQKSDVLNLSVPRGKHALNLAYKSLPNIIKGLK